MDKTHFRDTFTRVSQLYLKPNWNMSDFLRSQMIRDEIFLARANEKFTREEYMVLSAMILYLVDAIRDVLRKAGELHD